MKFSIGTRTYTLLFIVVCTVAVVSVVSLIYLYRQYDMTREQLRKTASSGTESEIQSLVSTIGKYMELPVSEVPTLATVTEVAKLPDIPFFAKAKSGDKVLIYTQESKAILYRPSTNKIIEVSAFNPQNTASETGSKDTVTVEIRNGTSVAGITSEFEKKLIGTFPSARITAKAIATRRDYSESLVIARAPSDARTAQEFSRTFDMAVSLLPRAEATTAADILIILGKDVIEAP